MIVHITTWLWAFHSVFTLPCKFLLNYAQYAHFLHWLIRVTQALCNTPPKTHQLLALSLLCNNITIMCVCQDIILQYSGSEQHPRTCGASVKQSTCPTPTYWWVPCMLGHCCGICICCRAAGVLTLFRARCYTQIMGSKVTTSGWVQCTNSYLAARRRNAYIVAIILIVCHYWYWATLNFHRNKKSLIVIHNVRKISQLRNFTGTRDTHCEISNSLGWRRTISQMGWIRRSWVCLAWLHIHRWVLFPWVFFCFKFFLLQWGPIDFISNCPYDVGVKCRIVQSFSVHSSWGCSIDILMYSI